MWKKLVSWKNDREGNLSIMLAVSIVPILALVGMAVDLQNTNTSRSYVQYVIDSAVIAGSKEMQAGKTKDEIEAYVDTYVDSALASKGLSITCGQAQVSFAEGSQNIDMSISCSQSTTLTALIGYEHLDFTVSSGSTYGVGKVDVAFVFDVSGSMGQNGKMSALKNAAQDAVDILLPEGGSAITDIEEGIEHLRRLAAVEGHVVPEVSSPC